MGVHHTRDERGRMNFDRYTRILKILIAKTD